MTNPRSPDRGYALALVVLMLLVTVFAQAGISYTFILGQLCARFPYGASVVAGALWTLRIILIACVLAAWLRGRRRALFHFIVAANSLATATLLLHVTGLLAILAGMSPQVGTTLVVDVTLIAISNIVVFSIWYWIVDPPGIYEGQVADRPWAFLFPQRGSSLPGFDSWAPNYLDYLALAVNTSLAFSPTDALPLTRIAKMLMVLQSVISVVTLTGVVGGVINILGSSG